MEKANEKRQELGPKAGLFPVALKDRVLRAYCLLSFSLPPRAVAGFRQALGGGAKAELFRARPTSTRHESVDIHCHEKGLWHAVLEYRGDQHAGDRPVSLSTLKKLMAYIETHGQNKMVKSFRATVPHSARQAPGPPGSVRAKRLVVACPYPQGEFDLDVTWGDRPLMTIGFPLGGVATLDEGLAFAMNRYDEALHFLPSFAQRPHADNPRPQLDR